MTAVLVTTRLKVADPTALTALATLRDRLGLDAISGLSREEVFLVEVDSGEGEALELVSGVVRGTNLFQNPNKHIYRIAVGKETPEKKSGDSWALIWTPGDGEELAESLWRHLSAARVSRVRRGWLWRFSKTPAAPAERFRSQVTDSLVVRSRKHGFLVNPASQESRLYDERPSVYDTEDAFFSAAPAPEA